MPAIFQEKSLLVCEFECWNCLHGCLDCKRFKIQFLVQEVQDSVPGSGKHFFLGVLGDPFINNAEDAWHQTKWCPL